jgi:uncharacterized membrane protein (UPF0127 family)
MRARRLFLVVVACVVVAACHRAPEEVGSPTSADSASVGVASAVAPASATAAIEKSASRCPADPEPNLKPLPVVSLMVDSDQGKLTLEAEVAQGEHDTERGLMYRTSMPEMHGMLFELARDDHAFWMHNTCISLDLLYIDHGQIVGIVESAPTLNDEPRRVGKPSDEVLELNAGFCMKHGVMVGQHVTRVPASGRAG